MSNFEKVWRAAWLIFVVLGLIFVKSFARDGNTDSNELQIF